jgi:hypothetical protein
VRTRAGSPWRDLPVSYWNWKTVYNRHRRWSADGTWEQILDRLRTGADDLDAEEWRLSIDATVLRAHHHASGARHRPLKDVPAERLAPTVLEVAERARGRAGAASNDKDSGGCGSGRVTGRGWAAPAAA